MAEIIEGATVARVILGDVRPCDICPMPSACLLESTVLAAELQ
jgi:hypothetical protein